MRNRSEEVLQTLNSEIQFLLSRIDELDQKLLNEAAKGTEAENNLIVEGYHLSGIYSCFEDIFSNFWTNCEDFVTFSEVRICLSWIQNGCVCYSQNGIAGKSMLCRISGRFATLYKNSSGGSE